MSITSYKNESSYQIYFRPSKQQKQNALFTLINAVNLPEVQDFLINIFNNFIKNDLINYCCLNFKNDHNYNTINGSNHNDYDTIYDSDYSTIHDSDHGTIHDSDYSTIYDSDYDTIHDYNTAKDSLNSNRNVSKEIQIQIMQLSL
ncbi:38330_t:CDS:1 [Gigaspora margarita]|uniref:38330_t:CDS:1 n=1 Tax=Gigaspora margarita TaxID=4874 RepID=A0ABN7UUW7_GIGMA|nr:38330_t:CDS:1 [Gigaspora margarita]